VFNPLNFIVLIVDVYVFLKRTLHAFSSSFVTAFSATILFFQRTFQGLLLSNWFLLITLLGPLVWKIISLAGFAGVTYFGVSAISNFAVNFLQSHTSVLPAPVFAIMGIMKLDVGFKMIVSAGTVKFTLMGWNKLTDTATRMRWGGLPPGTPNT